MVPHNLATLEGEKWSGCRCAEQHVLRATWYPGWWLLVSNHLLHPTTNCPTNFSTFSRSMLRHTASRSPSGWAQRFQAVFIPVSSHWWTVYTLMFFWCCTVAPLKNAFFVAPDWTGSHPTNGAQKCPAKLGRCATRFCSRRVTAVKGPQLGSGE